MSARLGGSVLWLDPAVGSPPPPYTTLLLTRVAREGQDEQRWDGGPDELRVLGSRLVTVHISATGADPLDRLVALQTALSLPSARAALPDGVTPVADEPVIAALTGESATLDITFRVPLEVLDAPGEITSAHIEGLIKRPDGAVAFTESIHFSR